MRSDPLLASERSAAFETVETSMDVVMYDTNTLPHLDAQDVASWAALLPTVRVGGALPVTFWIDGAFVVIEVTVPYVAPKCAEPTDRWIDTSAGQRIPLAIADGFPVPISGRYRLPAFSPDKATDFLRHLVREIYHHEIDEQFRVGDTRPFVPEH